MKCIKQFQLKHQHSNNNSVGRRNEYLRQR